MSNLHEMTPRVLGRGLMRGDRAEEKLGYCAQDAVHAVCRLHDLNEAETAALEAYLDGFSARMRRKPSSALAVGLRGECAVAYEEGTTDGLSEPITRVYPAEPESEPAP